MKFLLLIFASLISVYSAGQDKSPELDIWKAKKQITVLNKEKSYPELTYSLKEEVAYIPLETSEQILIGQGAHTYYYSNERILIAEWNRGNIYIFDMNGKVISHFNQKGGMGYTQISYVVYDPKNNEVFVMDKVIRKIIIFSDAGRFKRSFRMPKNLTFTKLDNFNDTLLLAWHEHQFDPMLEVQKQPYVLISKENGTVCKKLSIYLNDANPRYLMSGNYCLKMGYHEMGNSKFGNDFFLANISSDTIYYLDKNINLIPILTQSPSVFSKQPVCVGVVLRTDNYIILSIYPYDLMELKRRREKGERMPEDKVRFLMYEIETGHFYNCPKWKHFAKNIDIPKNYSIKLLHSYDLVDKYKLGLLKDELKEIAAGLHEGDNPVLEVTKFK